MSISLPINPALGTNVHAFPKTQYAKIAEMINAINSQATQIAALQALLALGSGVSGTFVSADSPTPKTITITNGIITHIA